MPSHSDDNEDELEVQERAQLQQSVPYRMYRIHLAWEHNFNNGIDFEVHEKKWIKLMTV